MYVLNLEGLNTSFGFKACTYRISLVSFVSLFNSNSWHDFFLIIGLYKDLFIFFKYRIVHFVFYFNVLSLMHVFFLIKDNDEKVCTELKANNRYCIPYCRHTLFEDKSHSPSVTRNRCKEYLGPYKNLSRLIYAFN